MQVSQMLESKYLKKEDVMSDTLVTIRGLSQENMAQEGQLPEFKYALHFQELNKPLILNRTNIELIVYALGSSETDEWVGRKIVLYNDPTISFGGRLVGGIRVKPYGQPAVPNSMTAPPMQPQVNNQVQPSPMANIPPAQSFQQPPGYGMESPYDPNDDIPGLD